MHDQELISFAQTLIKTQGYSSQEAAVANAVVAEMQSLDFDESYIDECGNAIGIIRGKKPGKLLLLDGHIDTVVAEPKDWTHPPFAGVIHEGLIYGRGIVDMKGSLAAMVHAAAQVDRETLAGSVVVSGTVLEEHFEGVALKNVVDQLHPDYVIIGEATNFQLNRAGRGRAEIVIETIGKSAHSASPQIGLCAVHEMVKVIEAMDLIPQDTSSFVGPTQLTLTDIISDPYPGFSVIPGRCRVTYDRRTIPGETIESVLAPIEADKTIQAIPHCAYIFEGRDLCYTGKELSGQKFFPAWEFPLEHPFVAGALAGLKKAGLEPKVGSYQFCTNGAYSAGWKGIPTIGFGPGDERLVHIADECLPVADLLKARDYFRAIIEEVLM
ncbi:MAG TPA: YgeY family selenium metabolism-linked hydrolase [Anaerolineaceae bacterium]|nr:YgeY family selenium metabolism-linked hydrolase [Anaerolineaceae bacterium]